MNHRAGIRIARWAIATALLAGCASAPRLVRTEVTTFDDWPALPADKSYVFARTLEFQNSLEIASYEDLVRDALATRGFRLVAAPAEANLVVTLRPSVTGAAVNLRERWPIDPFWGPPFGPYGRFGYGPFGYGGFYGGGFYDPFYGAARDMTISVYKRRLELDIDSRAIAGKRYYEGRVEASGGDASLPQAMPTLVRALFSDFPGNSGQTRRVDVPVVPVVPSPPR